MKENVKVVSINEESTKSTFYQHDKGQIIEFEEKVQDGVYVLMSNQNSKLADRKVVENNRVSVIDELLKEQGTLIINVQVVDETSETTTKTIRMSILHRKDASTGIAPENKPTFIQQMQQIMNSTKAIAEGVRTDADEGKFSYILTEEDKQEIAQEAGKSVDLSNYVTNTRRIANKELSTDITANDIILAMQDLTIFYVAVLKAMSQQTNIKQYFSLTSVLGEINKSFYSKPQIDNFFKEMNTSIESKIGDVNTILANVVEV